MYRVFAMCLEAGIAAVILIPLFWLLNRCCFRNSRRALCYLVMALYLAAVDAVVGGFHLFQLDPAQESSGQLLRSIGEALLPGETVYYTGHCTGEYAFGTLRGILGDRLRGISAGMEINI